MSQKHNVLLRKRLTHKIYIPQILIVIWLFLYLHANLFSDFYVILYCLKVYMYVDIEDPINNMRVSISSWIMIRNFFMENNEQHFYGSLRVRELTPCLLCVCAIGSGKGNLLMLEGGAVSSTHKSGRCRPKFHLTPPFL